MHNFIAETSITFDKYINSRSSLTIRYYFILPREGGRDHLPLNTFIVYTIFNSYNMHCTRICKYTYKATSLTAPSRSRTHVNYLRGLFLKLYIFLDH